MTKLRKKYPPHAWVILALAGAFVILIHILVWVL
jgi:hypothetical protein